nr:MAG TPA_asm: hypothetical protein [Bacteriophage sp.]
MHCSVLPQIHTRHSNRSPTHLFQELFLFSSIDL